MSERKIEDHRRRPKGPMRGMGRFDKPKNFRETFRKLLNYLRPYRIKLIIVIVFAIGSAAFSIVGPKILGKGTTKIFEGLLGKVSGIPGSGIDFQYIGNIILILIGLYLTSALFSYIQDS